MLEDATKATAECCNGRKFEIESIEGVRSPLAEGELLLHILDSGLHGYQLHPFFRMTDCSASLSRLRSAASLRRRVFSSRSCLASWASLASIPPYFAFQALDGVLGYSTLPSHVFGLPTCLQLLQRSNHLRLHLPDLLIFDIFRPSSNTKSTQFCADLGSRSREMDGIPQLVDFWVELGGIETAGPLVGFLFVVPERS